MLAHEVRALEVDAEHPVPLVGAQLVHRTSAGHTSGVDDDVEAAVCGQHIGDRARHRILVAHIDCDRAINCGAVYVEADHDGAFGAEPARARLADSRCRAGDERDHPVQPTHAVCSLKRVLEVKDGP